MDERTFFALMIDLHRDGTRQGPGSVEETVRALELTRLDPAAELSVADIGCGTGASTLVLAGKLPTARIVAVDLFPEFLERHAGRPEAAEVVQMQRQEAELFRRFQEWFSYGFYVARKR